MPPKNQDLSDSPAGVQALQILLDKLRNNEYPPGTPLRETVLAVEFNLSRNAVRWKSFSSARRYGAGSISAARRNARWAFSSTMSARSALIRTEVVE